MEIVNWIFFIILCGSAFTLRGIWGHNLGGGVMGVLTGLGLTVLFDLPLKLSIQMTFWLAIIDAIGAFVGWARHKTFQRFIRGYIFYGLFPSIIIAIYLFSENIVAQISLITLGPLGMGVGFGISYRLLNYIRDKMAKSFEKKNPHVKGICWGDRPIEPGEVSHIFIFKLDTWKIFLEYLSGILFGLTTLLVLNIFPISLKTIENTITIWNYLMALICYVLLPMGLSLAIIEEKNKKHGWKLPEEQQELPKSIAKKFFLIVLILTAIYGVVFFLLFDYFTQPLIIFLINYWFINALAKIYNPWEAIMFKTDCILDATVGIFLTILVFMI